MGLDSVSKRSWKQNRLRDPKHIEGLDCTNDISESPVYKSAVQRTFTVYIYS